MNEKAICNIKGICGYKQCAHLKEHDFETSGCGAPCKVKGCEGSMCEIITIYYKMKERFKNDKTVAG